MLKATKANEDYLEAILILEDSDKKVKSVEVAKILKVSKPAVNLAMKDLLAKELIEKQVYGSISLTNAGRKIAEKIYTKHKFIKNFLLQIGVSEEVAKKECCLIEHILSDETVRCMKNFISIDVINRREK